MVRDVVEQLCSRLEGFRQTGQPVNLRHAFAAVTMDVVTDYAFGTSYKCLEDPDFAAMWPEAVDSVSEQSVRMENLPSGMIADMAHSTRTSNFRGFYL